MCVRVTCGTQSITNDPWPGGNTCRKSQPPNANIILIAIEKYGHYAETSFLSLSLSFFQFCAALMSVTASRLPRRGIRVARSHYRPLKKTKPPTRCTIPSDNDDSVETRA